MSTRLLHRLALGLLALLVLLGPAACRSEGGLHRPNRASSQRDVGSVHVNVLAVAPWSHYVEALQPRFQLSADQARDLVIRDTRQEFEASQRAVSTGVSATQEPETSGLPSGPEGFRSGIVAALPSGVEGRDAMMEYWTANGLYQEVQILNRVIRDAVIPEGFRPYLVRLQITLVPRRRHQPYDAYTTVSFFSPDNGAPGPGGAEVSSVPPETSLRGERPKPSSPGGTGPVVLPLLVTDNLEASLQHRTSQQVQRLALSLLALPGEWAGRISSDLFSQELQGEVAGRDLNALLTVARVSQNTLRVRIGAMAESTADHAMVPRNHNVTLLLMAPQDATGEIEMVARTTLVDAETGEELPDTSSEEISRLLHDVGERYGIASLGAEGLGTLLRFAQTNDQRAFHESLVARFGTTHEAVRLSQSLWIELVSLLGGSQFASARFHLPGHGEADVLPSSYFDQTLVVIDDGKSSCEAKVRYAAFPEGSRLQATLLLDDAGRTLSIPADEAVYDPESQVVRLQFPSLSALGVSEAASETGNLRVSLREGAEGATAFDALYLVQRPPPVYPFGGVPALNPAGVPATTVPGTIPVIPR